MTIAELIDKLKEFPQDKIVAINYDVHEVDVKQLEWYCTGDCENGGCADENCEILNNEVVNLS